MFSSRRRAAPFIVRVLGVAVFVLLVGLGTWQLQRSAWKRDLIARVAERVATSPAPAPGPASWSRLTAGADEYRTVFATGTFSHDRETHVRAVTALGGGTWVLTPFRTDDGFTVLVNRGFVPPERRDPASRQDGQIVGTTRVTGLLRFTEPFGAFLQANDPASDLWVSRDVAAIAAARGLVDGVAPYFIDSGRTPGPGDAPVGGLTVVAFANNHLLYALVWYTLAAMLAGAAFVHRARRTR